MKFRINSTCHVVLQQIQQCWGETNTRQKLKKTKQKKEIRFILILPSFLIWNLSSLFFAI